MKKLNRAFVRGTLALLAVLAYFLLSWSSLETELNLTPEWTSDIDKTPESRTGEAPLPFRLGNKAGYFTHSGKIASVQTIPYKAFFTKSYYALFPRNAEDIPLYAPSGEEKCVIKGAGFPFIQQDRVFLFSPGGSTIRFVNAFDGTTISTYENAVPITAFNSSKNGSAVGYADGQLAIFDQNGKKKADLFPGGSDNPIILGADISESGKMYACVSGVDRQRFVLYRDEGNYKKIIFHDFLEKNVTRRTFVHFSDNDKHVYYDSVDSISIVDTDSLKKTKIEIPGTILDMQESPVAESVYILSRNGEKNYTVTILEYWTRKTGAFSFDADAAFILTDGNNLYIGRDNKISRASISKN